MLVDSDEVLAMFCSVCDCGEVMDNISPDCDNCNAKHILESVHERHQQWSRDSPEDNS